jgi:hypothetical protein
MNKKASLADSVYVPLYILIIAVTIFIAAYVWSTFSVNFITVVGVNSGVSNQTSIAVNSALLDIQDSFAALDYMFPFFVGGLLIASLIFAFKSGASIIYAFVSLIMWILALIMSVVFTNIFGEFQLAFPTIAAAYPIITQTMNNMKWIALFWAFLISIVMFSRNKQDDDRLQAMERLQ